MSLGRILSCWCVLLLSNLAIAQSPDAVKYAPRPILLVSSEPNVEGVMPMMFVANGQQHLEFVPVSHIKESVERGGQVIRLGDVLSALGEATETINRLTENINRLQAENDKLWKVAMKDAPKPEPPTIVVQQPVRQQPSPLEKYLLLRSLLQPPQPIKLEPPFNPNANRLKSDCTAQTIGTTTFTNCN